MNNIIWSGIHPHTPEKSQDTSYTSDELFRARNEIWFSCSVNQSTINKTIQLVHEIIHDDKLSAYRDVDEGFEIIIHIDSYGGLPSSAFKFIDCIEQLKKKKIRFRTIINGRACSAATLMALIGDKKQITRHSYAMIHELQCVTGGYHTHIKSYLKYLASLHTQIVDVYNNYRSKKVSPVTVETIEKWMSEETWFDANDYLSNGFVDEII